MATYATFEIAYFYCDECDSYQHSSDWNKISESDLIACPNHEEDDD